MSNSIPTSALPPAGWYADPEGAAGLRWWDGARWTEHVHMPDTRQDDDQTSPSDNGRSSALYAAGLLTAVFMPLIGFVIGVALYARPQQRGAGRIVLAISLAMFALIVYLMATR